MKKILCFFKSEPVLSVAAVLAFVSCFFVLPDSEYINYCNFEVLGILFSLMLVVAGLKASGLFEVATEKLSSKIKNEKTIIAALTMMCFFSSALITNDVALITFVPFSLELLKNQKKKSIIFAVTMETIAANLGSLSTPIGNPQNLFLYSYYSMSIGEFFKITLPLAAVCLALIVCLLCVKRSETLSGDNVGQNTDLSKPTLVVYLLLFALCILSVLGIVPWYISLAVICMVVLFKDKNLFAKADYILLVTFVCFFVFVGNMARIDVINTTVSKMLIGREIVFSAFLSQIISNVPAAAMLASFTADAKGLILGTNIGGLGTLIASMASLISYRYISKTEKVKSGEYILFFSCLNFALLIVLLFIFN